MASAPRWKVYNPEREYIAACKHVEDAAALCAINGDGSTIRLGHDASLVFWREGAEEFPAGWSYDGVAQLVEQRREAYAAKMASQRAATIAAHAARQQTIQQASQLEDRSGGAEARARLAVRS